MDRIVFGPGASAIIAIACIVASGPANAQPTFTPDCTDPVTQAEMNMCARASRDEAEREMEAMYQQVLAQFRQQDASNADLGPEYVGAEILLRESQDSWRTSSSDFCAARGVSFFGGSMRPAVVYACLAMLARSRTEELGWLLD